MAQNSAVAQASPVSDPEAFAFVQALASELSTGKVELPSFPDIAMRVRQVLADENVTPDKVVRVVGRDKDDVKLTLSELKTAVKVTNVVVTVVHEDEKGSEIKVGGFGGFGFGGKGKGKFGKKKKDDDE